MWLSKNQVEMPSAESALPGRSGPLEVINEHFVNGRPIKPPFPESLEEVVFGMGCFWGAERCFWTQEGVWTTAVGYAGGFTKNPTYEEVCSGRTGHTEAVRVVFDPKTVALDRILQMFWESHDPTQGMRQGNDVGSQYRSAIYTTTSSQLSAALASCDIFQRALSEAGKGTITTEISAAGPFYYAESYHQQYLAKNPQGYCGLGGTGVRCPVGIKFE